MDCGRENKKSFLKCHFEINKQKCFGLRTLWFIGISMLLFSCNSTCLYIHLLSQSFIFQMNHIFQRKIILFLTLLLLWITFPVFSTKSRTIFAFENLTFWWLTGPIRIFGPSVTGLASSLASQNAFQIALTNVIYWCIIIN